jgi:hypothetical protein
VPGSQGWADSEGGWEASAYGSKKMVCQMRDSRGRLLRRWCHEPEAPAAMALAGEVWHQNEEERVARTEATTQLYMVSNL